LVLEKNKSSSLSNPLAAPQRERAGANTFEKFEYQYHWALCRILDEHEQSTDYAVFIELHEDVVVSNSTNKLLAEFEFNQIKNLSSSPFNSKSLTNRPKGSGKVLKNSTLGKMILGVRAKPFIDKIRSINLVATCGFKLQTKTEGLKLSIISIGDVHEDCFDEIQAAIDSEIGTYPLPDELTFITPELPSTGFQDATIGRISRLINLLKSNVNHNPESIYRVLIDDLHRKGSVSFDYTQWNNLIKNKGLTYENVERVISEHVEIKEIEKLLPELESIANELGFKYHEKVQLKRAFERYHDNVRFNRALIVMSNQQAIQNAILNNMSVFFDDGVLSFLEATLNGVSESDKANFNDVQLLKAGIIYELICKNENK
jgi:hypothetical protein